MKGRQRTCSCSGSILWQPGGQFCLRRYMSNPQSLRKSYMRFKATCSLLRRLMCVDNSRLLACWRARSVLLLPTTEGKYGAALIIFMYKCNKCNVIMIQDTFQAIDEFYCYNWWPFFHLRCSNMFSFKEESINYHLFWYEGGPTEGHEDLRFGTSGVNHSFYLSFLTAPHLITRFSNLILKASGWSERVWDVCLEVCLDVCLDGQCYLKLTFGVMDVCLDGQCYLKQMFVWLATCLFPFISSTAWYGASWAQ